MQMMTIFIQYLGTRVGARGSNGCGWGKKLKTSGEGKGSSEGWP